MRAAALVPVVLTRQGGGLRRASSSEAQLAEARGLVRAAACHCAGARLWPLRRIARRSFFGPGAIAQLARLLARARIAMLFVDASLTSGQQAELERLLRLKVYDRTGLILHIFAQRAHSREGRLQIAHAQCRYQLGRLTRRWTHLERQRAGAGRGFLAGPGETQLEADRRQLRLRLRRLNAALARVQLRRRQQRRRRQLHAWPLVALVGYTNAGKSTLFERLAQTDGETRASPHLFATLDPCLRRVRLPDGQSILLSDTVGFITNLPTELIAAFRASLEHIHTADLILHVRDMANPGQRAQARAVEQVLQRLGVQDVPMLNVFNKGDLCPHHACGQTETRLVISAQQGAGLEDLRAALARRLGQAQRQYELCLPLAAGAALAWLEGHGCVLQRQLEKQPRRGMDGMALQLRVQLSAQHYGQFCKKFPRLVSAPIAPAAAAAAAAAD